MKNKKLEISNPDSLHFSDTDPLNLVERDLVSCSIIEFGSSWRLMVSDGLSRFEGAAVEQVGGNASRPPGVAANIDVNASSTRPALNHPVDVGLTQPVAGRLAVDDRLKEGGLLLAP
jgi:hypothetical protein